MKSLLRRFNSLNPQHRANGLAAGVALATMTFLHLECPPRPAGADTIRIIDKAPKIVITQPVAAPAAVAQSEEPVTPEEQANRTLIRKIDLLKQGVQFLKSTPDYTALFTKRELVGGELQDEQTISIKVRHAPFSIYLKWLDYERGREVMYVDGLNDGQMLVHSGGWKARLPAILMSPDSTLAMKEARYPVTKAGLLALAETIIEFNTRDLSEKTGVCTQLEDQTVGDRVCACYVMDYASVDVSPHYRKSLTLIDKEWGVPLYIKNFGWPQEGTELTGEELDESTLIEHYAYSEVQFRSGLTAMDFDHANEDYGFRRQ